MKKYVPSGYQIINIDVTGRTNGTPFTPETEDEKLLHSLLVKNGDVNNDIIIKPILLHLSGTPNGRMVGFGVVNSNFITLSSGITGARAETTIATADDKLECSYYED